MDQGPASSSQPLFKSAVKAGWGGAFYWDEQWTSTQNTPPPVDGSQTEKIPPATPQKSVIPGEQKRRPTPRFYQFEQLNEVTIKMTDGSSCIVQGSMGAGNYKDTRALGYLMEIGGAWVACVGQRRSEPLPLAKAEAAARDMHRGGEIGTDHPDKIRALNLAAAQLVDRAGRAQERRERASHTKPADWPIDLMGGSRRRELVDPDVRRVILDTELIDERPALQGDDYQLTYDENGYPELPPCLDRRPCKP